MTEQQPHAMSPEDEALAREAGAEESAAAEQAQTQALGAYLQSRVVTLAMEVKRRDRRIADLEAELAAYRDEAHEGLQAVSADGSGVQPD